MQKKSKQSEIVKPNVSLGSLGLKQYEKMILKAGDLGQTSEAANEKVQTVTVRDTQGEEESLRMRLKKQKN